MESSSESWLQLYQIYLAGAGLIVFIVISYLQIRSILPPRSLLLRLCKYSALSLLILPFMGRVLFSQSLVMVGSCVLALVGGVIVLKQKMRR
jgi:hypothetical protein